MAERGVSGPGVPEQRLWRRCPAAQRGNQRLNEDLLGPKGQTGKDRGWGWGARLGRFGRRGVLGF